MYGAGGNDVIKGGSGSDTLKGQRDDDQVIGNAGSDKLVGGGGDDTVNSKDTISANDSLDGGTHVAGDKKLTDPTEKSIVGFPWIVKKVSYTDREQHAMLPRPL